MRMKEKIKDFLLLHILLFVYSMGGICSKLAASEEFLSVKFILLYGILLFIMFLYAIMWQQVLKRMKLVTAYANKSVTIIWGMFWGVLLFKESISVFNVIGILIIIAGVYFVVTGEVEE
mgnify:CR=1 FL=1